MKEGRQPDWFARFMIQNEVSHLNYLEHLTVHSSPRILVV